MPSVRIWPDGLFVLARQILYQRDGKIIALARPDLAVSGTVLSSVAQAVDIRATCAVWLCCSVRASARCRLAPISS